MTATTPSPDCPVDSTTPVGTRVKASFHALKGKRDYWLNCGHTFAKNKAKEDYDRAANRRGAIAENLVNGVTVHWDDGGVSHCLRYMVVTA